MRIGLDVSPLIGNHAIQHRVRGTGFYTKNLKEAFENYFPENTYTFFTNKKEINSMLDIVHYPYFEPFFLTVPFKKITKTVITIHDLTPLKFPEAFPSGIKGKLKWEIQKILLKNIEGIITDSDSSKKDIIKFTNLPEEKISVVYLAASDQFKVQNLKFEVENVREKYKLPEKFVLYVGDVTWNKNLPRLIRAIQKTDIPLVMVGKALIDRNFDATNPWNQDRQKILQLTQGSRQIICPGFVSDEDLVFLYNAATVFAMPSLYEGFGLPVLEAMKSGCPVVTSHEGSLPEVVGEAAHFVDAYSVDSISEGIIKVFSDTKLQKELREKGLIQSSKFSWEKTANATLKVYGKIL
jgi:glycosyltransferase involved in cell wall biosynthesis